ncbi:MAG: N-acetylmuramoyl-L-alanine amidase [Candidatus Latescibacter sp.]|nr:N-acetylmuramoyl-L-alanine amidase [Candidatus Latescibacter sp.]
MKRVNYLFLEAFTKVVLYVKRKLVFNYSPLSLGPFPPKGGKGVLCSTFMSCPLRGKDVRRTGRGLLQIFLTLALILAPVRTAVAAEVENFTPFSFITLDKTPYISLVDIGETYHVKISYDPVTLGMTLARGTKTITVYNLSKTAKVNDTPVNLAFPARLIRGAIYVPASAILPLLSEMLNISLNWDSRKKGILSVGSRNSILGVSLDDRAQGTLLRISLSDSLQFSTEMAQYNWLTFIFPDGAFSRAIGPGVPAAGMVLDSRFTQRDEGVQLSFHISEDMESYDISRTEDSPDILISLRKKRSPGARNLSPNLLRGIENVVDSLSPKLDGETSPPAVVSPADERLWSINTVIIDPGHGGQDSGAVGAGGTKEKNVVLAVAKELKKLVDERQEITAVMTRNSDTFVGLYQRATLAKRANGKLFISIHANAGRNREAEGMEIFFLSAARTEDAKDVAQRENESVKYEDNPGLYRKLINDAGIVNDIQNDMASNVFLKESQDLCSVLLDNVLKTTRQTNRGVKQAGFYVLAGTRTAMPSVLFEIGFISNPEEEKMLNRISYQKRLAQAIYDSIIKFKERHERGLFSRSE